MLAQFCQDAGEMAADLCSRGQAEMPWLKQAGHQCLQGNRQRQVAQWNCAVSAAKQSLQILRWEPT